MSVFDVSKAVIDKELSLDGEFVQEQTKLHSLNKLSGRIFNPYGLMNTIGGSDNPYVSQLISRGASDILQAGAYDTTNGVTFARTADNNADELFFDNVRDFKADSQGGSGSFVGSLTKKAVNGLVNRIGQLAGIEVKATRSMLAQTIAYDSKLIDGGDSQSLFPDMYDGDIEEKGTVKLDPIGSDALAYTHDIVSFTSRVEEVIRLKRKINDGYYAQNVAVKKPQDVIDIEQNNLNKRKSKSNLIIRSKLLDNVRGLIDSFKKNDYTGEFWVKRQKNYNAFSNNKYLSSGSPKLNESFVDKYKYIIANSLGMTANEDETFYFDQLRHLMLNELEEKYKQDGVDYNLDHEHRRQKELKSNRYNISSSQNQDANISKFYTKINNKYKIGSDETHDLVTDNGNRVNNFTNYLNAEDGQILDEMSESDVIEGINGDSDEQTIGSREASEFVYFSIQDVRNDHIIYLEPTINSVTEDLQPTYTDKFYLGRTESLPSYERTTRSVNVSFNLHARTPKELIMIYRKLEFIQKLTYPIISQGYKKVQTPITRLSLGDFYKNMGTYITSFTKSIDNNTTTWESESGYRVPKHIECSLSFVVLHDSMPYVNEDYEFADDVNIHDINLDQNNV